MSIIESEILEKFSIAYLNQLEFSDLSILAKVQRGCQKVLRCKDYALVNTINCDFFEENLKETQAISIEIKWVNPIVGYGVFAKEGFPFFTYVGEYVGIVRKLEIKKDALNNYLFNYLIGSQGTPWVIDAEKKGNFTRFINHSSQPNMGSKWLISNGMAHLIFYANQRIRAGEQLTIDYGPHYWRNRSTPQQHPVLLDETH